jgi:TatD DNase family protein
VDSHAHLDAKDFDLDRDAVVGRAFASGLRAILCPTEVTNPKSLDTAIGLTERFPGFFAAAGVHPHEANHFREESLQRLQELASSRKIMAIGEIGLDYHYSFSSREEQIRAFCAQLELAQELKLPVVVHSRNAGRDVVSAVQERKFTRRGVLHCFTEDWTTAAQMMDRLFFISFSGILTYPNASGLRETAKKIPLEKILIETDSPYLVPASLRGTEKRNEPAFVAETAKVLAELKAISIGSLAESTTRNFLDLFSV